jgi:hypothetical protein
MDTGATIDVDAMHVVDPGETYQTTEGWGTSICWFGNVIGGWDAANRDTVADRYQAARVRIHHKGFGWATRNCCG